LLDKEINMGWRVLPASTFCDYQEEWDRINKEGTNSPVLNSSFISCALDAFGSDDKNLAFFEEEGQITTMGVLEKRKFGVWDTYQPSQSPLGFWINQSSIPLNKLLGALCKALPGIVLKIGITQQDPDIYPRPGALDKITTLDYIDTAKIELTGTFEDYWAARGKNLRHNLKRQRNRLDKEHVTLALNTITNNELIHDAIRVYGELESAGWKSETGTAIHTDNAQGKFYIGLLQAFSNNGKGRIYQYTYNNEVVATDLCIEQGGTFVILKTTYDENIKTSSPAFLMRQDIFRQLFDDKQVKSIEFYGKVMDWHTKWSDQVRTIYHINYTIFF